MGMVTGTDPDKVNRNFATWAELFDLGYEMALAALRRQFPGKNPLEQYRRRWNRWQNDHLKASILYLEAVERAERTRRQSDSN